MLINLPRATGTRSSMHNENWILIEIRFRNELTQIKIMEQGMESEIQISLGISVFILIG